MKLKMYINANAMSSWQEEYESEYPYKLTHSAEKGTSKYNWCVAEYEIDIPDMEVDLDHIVLCQIEGLEAAIRQTKSDAYDSVATMEEEIAQLRFLPAPAECSGEVIEPDVTADDESYFDQNFVEGEDY